MAKNYDPRLLITDIKPQIELLIAEHQPQASLWAVFIQLLSIKNQDIGREMGGVQLTQKPQRVRWLLKGWEPLSYIVTEI